MAHFNYNLTTFSARLSPGSLALLHHFTPSLTGFSGCCDLGTLQGCRVGSGGQEGAGVRWWAGSRHKPPGILIDREVEVLTFPTPKVQISLFGKHIAHSKFELRPGGSSMWGWCGWQGHLSLNICPCISMIVKMLYTGPFCKPYPEHITDCVTRNNFKRLSSLALD